MFLLAAVAAGMALVGYNSIGHIVALSTGVNEAELQRYEAAEVRALSRAIQRDALNTIIEPPADRQAYADRIAKRSEEMLLRSDALIAGMGKDVGQLGMGEFAPLIKAVATEIKAVSAAALAGNEQQALAMFREKVRPGERAASKVTDAFIEAQVNRVQQSLAAMHEAETALTWRLVSIATVGICLSVAVALLVMMVQVIRPLAALTRVTDAVAVGKLDIAIPGADRRDELGNLANALEVFRQQAQEKRRLEADALEAEEVAAQQRRAALESMATTIEAETRAAMEHIGRRAAALTENADAMSSSADAVAENCQSVAAAADQALNNSQTVAAASEQLAASITEISGQVSRASDVSRDAAVLGTKAEEIIRSLEESVARIGDVVQVIGDVAEQTNLLALNATIEAARAGEAGKGFAVVAGEVKNLANQTARSTEDITRQINEVQQVTRSAVQAVNAICRSVQQMELVSASVAAAVEEQGAATGEISRNVGQAADAAREVASKIALVSQEAISTGTRAQDVRGTSADVSAGVVDLRSLLVQIVRASVQEVDSRSSVRENVDVSATFRSDNCRVFMRLTSLSVDGAGGPPTPGLKVGDIGWLTIPGRPDIRAIIIASDARGIRMRFTEVPGKLAV